MRLATLLLLLASAAPAQDVLVPRGDTLATFQVVLQSANINRSSPEGLARTWAEMHVEEQEIAARFQTLFEQAHIDILRRFYSEPLVALQAKLYKEEVRTVNDLRCQVLETKPGPHERTFVYVRRSWIDGIGRPREDRAQLLIRQEKDSSWRLVEVRYETQPGVWERRDRSIPPVTVKVPVPKPADMPKDGETVAARFTRMKTEFYLLRFRRNNAQHELFRHFFTLTEALLGTEVANEARANQPPAKPRNNFFFVQQDPQPQEDGSTMLRISAVEKAEGQDGGMVAGEAEFIWRKDTGGMWRVMNEALRREPEQPAEPVKKKLGLFLMG
ncbi:MAG: hypothetical protein AAGD14_08090 [Planctomycetota bacterium]